MALSISTRRLRQRFFDRPPQNYYALPQHGEVKSAVPRPSKQRPCITTEGDIASYARVGVLRGLRSPTNILRLVMAVIVDSIDRMFVAWTKTYVRKERVERLSPSIAHSDTSPTVISEGAAPFIKTPLLHRGPCAMLSGLTQTVCAVPRLKPAPLYAPARSRMSRLEIRRLHCCVAAAIASAWGHAKATICKRGGYRDKRSEPAANWYLDALSGPFNASFHASILPRVEAI